MAVSIGLLPEEELSQTLLVQLLDWHCEASVQEAPAARSDWHALRVVLQKVPVAQRRFVVLYGSGWQLVTLAEGEDEDEEREAEDEK